MPLINSKSDKAFKTNVRTLMHEVGKSTHVQSRAQALAIAYSKRRGKADGGVSDMARKEGYNLLRSKSNMASMLDNRGRDAEKATAISDVVPRTGKAVGGLANIKIPKPPAPSFYQRDAVRAMIKRGVPSGVVGRGKPLFADGGHITPINSSVPGRTDKHPVDVPSGSYILPADTISHLGENNTAAGIEKFKNMLYSGYFSGKKKKPRTRMFAAGGAIEPVPIIVAGGELAIHPDAVRDFVGNGDIKKGHDKLDQFVLNTRKDHIKTLRKLAPPQR